MPRPLAPALEGRDRQPPPGGNRRDDQPALPVAASAGHPPPPDQQDASAARPILSHPSGVFGGRTRRVPRAPRHAGWRGLESARRLAPRRSGQVPPRPTGGGDPRTPRRPSGTQDRAPALSRAAGHAAAHGSLAPHGGHEASAPAEKGVSHGDLLPRRLRNR